MDIIEDNNLWLVEDNCDALGAKFRGKYTGTFGDLSTCSFYPAHHITMGEGGAVLVDDPLLRKIVTSFRDWGRDCWCEPGYDNTCGKRFNWKFDDLPFGYDHKYVYSHIGYNLKITDMQAAIGVEQLKKLPLFIKKRRENFNFLMCGLKKFEKNFLLPESLQIAEPSWFGFPVLIKNTDVIPRDHLVKYLEDKKIATRMLFGGNLVRQPAYKCINCRIWKDLKNSDTVLNNLFWIGVYPGLNRVNLEYIISTFSEYMNSIIESD